MFYNVMRLVKDVPSQLPIEIEPADVSSRIFSLMKEDREFFGLIDLRRATLQAFYDGEDDLYWFEGPPLFTGHPLFQSK